MRPAGACGDLLGDGRAVHPELLIVDPWAVARPEVNRLVARFKLADKPCQVVIPWNPADAEAMGGMPSIAQFGRVLQSLIPAVGNRYLGHVAAYPPDGSVVEKPTLHSFTPSPANPSERARA